MGWWTWPTPGTSSPACSPPRWPARPALTSEALSRALVLASLAAGLYLRQEEHKQVTAPELLAAAEHHNVIDRFVDREVQTIMKVLVLGATGLLGREVYRNLREEGLGVVGAGHHRAHGDVLSVDARNPHSLDALFAAVGPDVVLNTAGERRPDHWSRHELRALNVEVPHLIAERCKARGAWLIHLSSDYVFDGKQPPHAPEDRRRPLNSYGQSKADSEYVVHSASPSATILRVPVLHGPVEFPEESNLSSLIALVAAGTPATLDDWAIRYPTATGDVARVLRQMLTHAATLHGRTCHWSGTEAMTKYSMAHAIGDILDAPTGQLRPERHPHPTRPADPRLDCRLLEELGIDARTPLREALPPVIASTLARQVAP